MAETPARNRHMTFDHVLPTKQLKVPMPPVNPPRPAPAQTPTKAKK